jgi:hypothetical protein
VANYDNFPSRSVRKPAAANRDNPVVQLFFDYGKIKESVRDIVEKAAIEIKLRERRAAEDVIEIGEYLIQVKEVLPHGQFGEWRKTEFGYSHTTSAEFMNVARRFRGKFQLSGILGRKAMQILAWPSVSDEAVEAVVQESKARNRPLQIQEVEAIVNEYRQAAIAANAEWSESEIERRAQVEQGKTVLANMATDIALIAWATSVGLYERIDRATEWGNPFVVDEDGDRDMCILKYEDYYFMKNSLWPKLETLRGKVLGCWCYPEDCHGKVLLNFLKFPADRPFEVLGFGYPIGEAEDFERFEEMKTTWSPQRYLEEHG